MGTHEPRKAEYICLSLKHWNRNHAALPAYLLGCFSESSAPVCEGLHWGGCAFSLRSAVLGTTTQARDAAVARRAELEDTLSAKEMERFQLALQLQVRR